MSRHQWNRHAAYDRYEEYYPPYADPYYEDDDEYEMDYYPSRRRYLPDGCASVLAVAIVILAFVLLMLLTFHPQGFELFHF
jgi:hypothetical protein